jgi:2-polyprenyl-6-methoxyphenol hydroxylase-like FAD-dependent oxidoreductase
LVLSPVIVPLADADKHSNVLGLQHREGMVTTFLGETGQLGERAIVVGAGMGGLMAAGVLSRYFSEVIVLDKDKLPDDFSPRKSVPQGSHVHALLVQGRRNLEKIFPGLTSDLIDRGVVCSRSGLEFCVHDDAGWQPRRDLDLLLLTMSRPLLEGTVREHATNNDRVSIRGKCRVEGWDVTEGMLSGVTIRGEGGPETLAADLVIDATGRTGNSLSWLEASGYGPVEETTLEIGTGYASALFKQPENWSSAIDSMSIMSADPDTRGGFIFSIENGHWFASLQGRFDQQPPSDPDEFMAYAKNLCVPDFYDWISQGERVTPIKTYKAPISRWRHYDRLADFPGRLLPLGDAVAHVNPVYGQGMTLASTHVMNLWEILAEQAADGGSLDGLAKPYFDRVQRFTASVWTTLENVEFTYAGTKGTRPADMDMRIAYRAGLRKLIEQDPALHKSMIEVGQLIQSSEVMVAPEIMARVMEVIQADAEAAQ